MEANHVAVGIFLFTFTVVYLGAKYVRAPKKRPLSGAGWMGLLVIAAAEALLLLHVPWVGVYFTATVWTGYLLLADSMVVSLRGESRITRSPGHFLSLALWSVPLWLLFEAYNLRLGNWEYVGLPDHPLLRYIGYVWAFATIWPAIFETSDLIRALGFVSKPHAAHPPVRWSTRLGFFVWGAVLLACPLLLPAAVGAYLFGAVWLGFILLLEPLNYLWARRGSNGDSPVRSLLADWEAGDTSILASLLLAGGVCGILWEFWNYWADAKWIYVFPIWQKWKIFEMPLPGFLGFPPFAVECFVMYEFLRGLKGLFWGARSSMPSPLGALGGDSDVSAGRE